MKDSFFMKYIVLCLIFISLIISFAFTDVLQKTAPKSIDVLIITGMDIPAHDWKKTTEAIKEELTKAKDTQVNVEVLENPYELESTNLKKYDVVFLHFNNWMEPDPSQKSEEKLKRFVAGGGGLVLMHFASGAFRNWDEFPKLAGKVWDGKNTHDPRGPFLVEIVDTLHPITKGIKSYDTDDELYICLTGDQPVHILAKALSKVTGRYHPMAFVHTYGKGRVFHTTLGHDARAIHITSTGKLIRNGVIWAAARSVPAN